MANADAALQLKMIGLRMKALSADGNVLAAPGLGAGLRVGSLRAQTQVLDLIGVQTVPTPCPQGCTDYEACFAPFRYCPVKGCGRVGARIPTPAPDFDENSEALAWARAKVQRVIDKMRRFEQRSTVTDSEQWRKFGNMLHREFIGGEGCNTAAFDARLPDRRESVS